MVIHRKMAGLLKTLRSTFPREERFITFLATVGWQKTRKMV
jgi:hypothetical protein